MFKSIYKFVLISLLSGCLMLLDFSSKGVWIQIVSAETKTNSSTQASPNNINREAAKTSGGQSSDMMATLTMIVVGLVTSRLYSCKMTPDMMAAAAGGAMFIGGEIMSTLGLNKTLKEMEAGIKNDNLGNMNQAQIEAQQKLKESYEKAKKTANTKKMLQMAAAAAFLVAAGLAIGLYMKERAAVAACTSALTAAGPACASMFAASCSGGATCIYPLKAGGIQATGLISKVMSTDALSLIPGPSAPKAVVTESQAATDVSIATAAAAQCPAVSGATGSCASIIAVNKITKGFCPVPLAVTKSSLPMKQYYTHLGVPEKKPQGFMGFVEKYILSSSHAFSMIGIAGTAAVIFIVAMSKTIGAMVDNFLFSPMNRAIVWGVLAGLSFMASSATAKVITQIDGYIKQVDGIIKGVKANSNGIVTPNVGPQNLHDTRINPNLSNNSINPTDYDGVDLSAANGEVIPCFTGPENANCKSFADASRDVIGNSNFSPDTQNQLMNVLKTANGFNGASSISSGSMQDAARLAGTANALRTKFDKLKKSLNEKLKDGKSFEGESKKFADLMDKAVRDELKRQKSDAPSMLASFGGGKSGSGLMSNAVTELKDESALKKTPAAPAGVVDIGASAGAYTVDSGLTGIDNGSKTAMTEKEAKDYEAQLKAASAGGSIDEYDLKNDITTDSNSSLFELISHRYKTSGYERLFERVKETK